jgi:hypothetical protein
MVGEGSVDDGSASRPQQIAISPHGDFVYVTNAGKGADGSIAEYMINRATGAPSRWRSFAAVVCSSHTDSDNAQRQFLLRFR